MANLSSASGPSPYVFFFLFMAATSAWAASFSEDLTTLSLEELMSVEVISASRKPQKYFSTAASIYVITPDDIRRSGMTTIPEVLRLAPGINIQRVNSHAWDISVRGFNNSIFANKLLVLIDGRAVYTPLFGGVFWDVQDTVLEDIERIEVVRGPGGALWGANAVNGVVNIITKRAADTQGTLLSAGAGTQERFFSTIRHGGQSKGWFYRAHAKYFDRGEGFRVSGTANDEWAMARTGFRAEKEQVTVQGDFYQGHVGQRTQLFSLTSPFSYIIDKPVYVQGGNLMAKYNEEDWSVQGYWDMTNRDLQSFSERRNTFDLEYSHKQRLSWRQELNWGAGYRLQLEDIGNSNTVRVSGPSQLDQLFSLFMQDELWMVEDKLKLIFGAKLEHNIYTRFEVQPNVRLSYEINDRNVLWAAASRAVRTPSRIEEDAQLTASFTAPSTFNQTVGNHDLGAENLHAYKIGYRTSAVENMLIDVDLFLNHYDRLITLIPGGAGSQNGFTINSFPFVNGIKGNVYGAEISDRVRINPLWSMTASYSLAKIDLQTEPDIVNLGLESALEETVPRHSFFLMSSWQLPSRIEFNAMVRYSDSFSNGRVPSVTQLDLNMVKRIREWELALVAQNLLRGHHRESVLATNTQVERGGYAKVTRRF